MISGMIRKMIRGALSFNELWRLYSSLERVETQGLSARSIYRSEMLSSRVWGKKQAGGETEITGAFRRWCCM